MKKAMAYGVLIAFLTAVPAGWAEMAQDKGGTVSIDQVPVVVVQNQQELPAVSVPPGAGKPEAPPVKAQESPGAEKVLFDMMVLRPAGVVACSIGLVTGALALPFAAFSEGGRKAVKTAVGGPCGYAFTRPVGQLTP